MKLKAIMLVSVLAGLVATEGAEARNLYSLGTASTAGTFYILGAGFASHINKRCPQVKITAEITAGTLENYYLVKRKKMDLGMVSPDIIIDDILTKKYGGQAKEKARSLIWSWHTSDYHWIVRKNSPIKDLCDIKGKSVGVGPMGTSGMVSALAQIQAVCGYEPGKEYKALYYTFAESQNAIKDDTLDIGQTVAGTPVASVVELARTVDIRLISLTKEQQKKCLDSVPTLVPVTIPAGSTGVLTPRFGRRGGPRALSAAWTCRKRMPTPSSRPSLRIRRRGTNFILRLKNIPSRPWPRLGGC